jgi:hypothetical protein
VLHEKVVYLLADHGSLHITAVDRLSSPSVFLTVGITVFHDCCKAIRTTNNELRFSVTVVCLAPFRGFGFHAGLFLVFGLGAFTAIVTHGPDMVSALLVI